MEINLIITPNDHLRAEEFTAIMEAAEELSMTPDEFVAQAIRGALANLPQDNPPPTSAFFPSP